MKIGRSTDYAPDTRPTRSEDWFLAAIAGRDAAKAGKDETANPFVNHRPDWKAWRGSFRCWKNHREDLTARFRLRPEKRRPYKVDYTTEAIHDFTCYALAPDLPDEDRAWAMGMARETKRQADIAHRLPTIPGRAYRTPEQMEADAEAAWAKWPEAGITEISVRTGIMDTRLRRTRAWQRRIAAKEGKG